MERGPLTEATLSTVSLASISTAERFRIEMRTSAKLLVILLLPLFSMPAIAADSWPKKGDKVFLSLPLKASVSASSLFYESFHPDRLECENTFFCMYTHPTCSLMKVRRVDVHKSELQLKVDGHRRPLWLLKGGWRAIVHEDWDACTEAQSNSERFKMKFLGTSPSGIVHLQVTQRSEATQGDDETIQPPPWSNRTSEE